MKLSEKLKDYFEERGEIKGLIKVLREEILKSNPTDQKLLISNIEQLYDNEDELPLLCFKCSYQTVLAKEGRARALQIYNRAKDEHS